MELNQLRCFQKVARTESVTKAAQELFIAQPTLSQSLSRLEESLGCPLFLHQPGKRLQLNDAGRLFLSKVDRAFAELDAGVQQVRELNARASVQVSLASSIHDLCNDLVLNYFRQNPNARISQRLVEINALTELLLNDEIDFAISPCPLSDPRLDCQVLYTEELMAVVGPGHRLYGRRTVEKEALLQERFLCNYSESDRNYLEMLFEGSGAELDIMLESNEPSTIRKLAESGAGVAFRPARLVMRQQSEQAHHTDCCGMRVTGASFLPPTCISKKKNRFLLQSAADFYDYAVQFCQEESDQVAAFLAQYGT